MQIKTFICKEEVENIYVYMIGEFEEDAATSANGL